MQYTENEIRCVENLLFLLNNNEKATILVEYPTKAENFGGYRFDREISESIRSFLTKSLKANNQ